MKAKAARPKGRRLACSIASSKVAKLRGHGDRAERLLVHDVGFVRNVGEQGRLEEEAAVAALAAGEHARALGLGVVDQCSDRVGTARIGERAHLGVGVQAVADLHLAAVRSAKPLRKAS